VELSAFYLDVLKDRLYVYASNSWERRSAQTVLFEMAKAITLLIAPFLSSTAEEVWEHLRRIDPSLPESVFLQTIPTSREELKDQEILKDYEIVLKVRDDVMSAVELCRKEKEVNHPYEAEVYIWGNEEVLKVLKKYEEDLKYLFTVSKVSLEESGNQRLPSENLPRFVGGCQAGGGQKVSKMLALLQRGGV
jgi:isoleucyl-tRNA synthetase